MTMTWPAGVLRMSARCARWGLWWFVALALSMGLAYATTVAVAGAAAPRDAQITNVCATRLLYVGMNSWVPAEPSQACRESGATS